MATRASKRKLSVPASPTSSPTAAKMPAADPVVTVYVKSDPPWATALAQARDDDHFLDATLVAGGRRIQGHKAVLISFSPYLHGLFTSGLSESKLDEVEIKDVDGAALAAVVGCFYTGTVSVSVATAGSVIRTANMLQVGAIEVAVIDFFVKNLQPGTAFKELAGFATEMAVGPSGCALQQKCLQYIWAEFSACAATPAFLEVGDLALLAKVLESDALAAKGEDDVLAAVRTWVTHDKASRAAAVKTLLPLVRFPLLTEATKLKMFHDPLLLSLMALPDGGAVLAGQLLKECIPSFVMSEALGGRGKVRKGDGPARSPPRYPTTAHNGCMSRWDVGGNQDAINVTPSAAIWLCGLTMGTCRDATKRLSFVLSVKRVSGDTAELNEDKTPVLCSTPVGGWCDVLLASPIRLEAGCQYRIEAKCSSTTSIGFVGQGGEKSVTLPESGGLTLQFDQGAAPSNGTSDKGGQLNHLLYRLSA